MEIERRGFLGTILGLGAGAMTLGRGVKAFAKGLPSDPGAPGAESAGPEEIVLPAFEKDGTLTLEKALLNRKSGRDYDPNAPLSPEQLSRLLWATTGANRPNGHRTTPSAVASYPVEVLAALPEGVYRFEPEEHRLVKVLSKDIRREIPRQPGHKKAAMILLYVINEKKFPGWEIYYADIEIGCMVQNAYLQSAALGMGSCVFAIVRYKKVSELLGLEDKRVLRIAQTVGPIRD